MAGGFSINNHLDEEDGAGDQFAMGLVGGGVGIKAGASIIIDKGSGNRNRLGELLVVNGKGVGVELGNIEGGEAGL